MAELQIVCVQKAQPDSLVDDLILLGTADGVQWTPVELFISVTGGINAFYVLDASGERVDVIPVYGRNPHVRTSPHPTQEDALLQLPACD